MLNFDLVFSQQLKGASPVTTGGGSLFFGGTTKAGLKMNKETAMRLPAFYCALNNISDSYALLPKSVYKKTDSERKRQLEHPLDYLIHEEPNSKMTSAVFDKLMVCNYFLKGNAIAINVRDNAGNLVAKEIVDPDDVIQTISDNKLFYTIKGKVYASDEVFHVPYHTHNGYWGVGIVQYAADNLGVSYGAQVFQGNSFANKGLSTGVLESEKHIDSNIKKKIQSAFSEAMNTDDVYRVAALDEGMKYKSIALTADQAKVVEATATGVADIARWFNIPLSKLHVSGEGGYNFLVQMSIEYLQAAVMPIADKFKKEEQRKSFTAQERAEGLYVHHNYNKLLQADPKSRAQYYKDLMNIKSITPNEVRKLEGFDPYEGGDEPLQMVNMQTQQQIDKDLNQSDE